MLKERKSHYLWIDKQIMIVKEEETDGDACTLVWEFPGCSQNGFPRDMTSFVSFTLL